MKLPALATAAFLLLPLSLHAEEIETWQLERLSINGTESPRPFLFLVQKDDGSFAVSNGVEKIPCWLSLSEGQFHFIHGAKLAWGEYSSISETDGFYQLTETSLTLVWPTIEQRQSCKNGNFSFSEIELNKSNEVYFFKKLDFRPAESRSKKLDSYLKLLTSLNVGFAVNDIGQITEINLINSSVETIDTEVLRELPNLRKLVVAKDTIPLPQSARFEVEVLDMTEDRDWKMKNLAEAGKGIHQGRLQRSALEKLSPDRTIPPVFYASKGDGEISGPAVLMPVRNKTFAVTFTFGPQDSIAESLTHPSLTSPVPLGRSVLTRFKFDIREIGGNPGEEWLFTPMPEGGATLEDGMILRVCLPDGTFRDGITWIGAANGIAPGGRVDWDTFVLTLMSDPSEPPIKFVGCPVIDRESGYLVGFVNAAREDGAIETELISVSDLVSIADPPDKYQGSSFFGIEGRLPVQDVNSALVGVLPAELLDLPFGQINPREFLLKRPYYHYNMLGEFLGKEYLFSKIEYPDSRVLSRIEVSSNRVRNDDTRVRDFSEFLFSNFGAPEEFGGSFPSGDGKLGFHLQFQWKREKYAIFYEISQQKIGNRLIVKLHVSPPIESRRPQLETIRQPNRTGIAPRNILNDFFAWVDTLEPQMDHQGNSFEEFMKYFPEPK